MTRPILAMIALVALLPVPGAAQSCDPDGDQASLNQCAGEAFQTADDALNAVYSEVAARLSEASDAREALVRAQRAWIALRDAECEFAASAVAGGSIYPMIVTGCRTRLTEARTAELAAYLDCEEGDLSCPVPPP